MSFDSDFGSGVDIPIPDPFGDLDEWEDDIHERENLLYVSYGKSQSFDDDGNEDEFYTDEDVFDNDRIHGLKGREQVLDDAGMGFTTTRENVELAELKARQLNADNRLGVELSELDVRRKKAESFLADHERKNNPDFFDRVENAIKGK